MVSSDTESGVVGANSPQTHKFGVGRATKHRAQLEEKLEGGC